MVVLIIATPVCIEQQTGGLRTFVREDVLSDLQKATIVMIICLVTITSSLFYLPLI